MFSRVSRLLLQTSLQSLSWGKNAHTSRMFSTHKDINRLRETARIAEQVIKMIQKPFQISELEKEAWGHESPEQQIKRVNSYALAERIKNALMNLNNQQQSVNDVLKLFTTGVEISDQIFHQQRIQNAKTGQKIVYYPNSIISSQIFSLMGPSSPQFNNYQKRLVLKGYKGISKTLSVSLLWQLSQLIDDYRFISQETGDQTKDKFTYPKIVYWSIRSQDTLEKVYESLLLQLPELKKQYNVNDLIRKKIDIGQFYLKKYGIKVHIVVDQINLLASWFRIIAPILSKKTKFQRLTPSQKKQLQAIKYLMKLVKTISQKFSKTFYLSSMDIETQFLRKCDLATDENQTVVRIRQVKYAELIYNDSSLVELCHFFVAEFNEKNFKTSGIKASQEQLRETQEMCVQYLKKKLDYQNNPEYFFTTFLAISKQILESNTAQLNKNTDLKVFLFKRFTNLIQKSTEHTRQQFYEHFLKDDQLDPTRINTVLNISEEIKEIIEKEYFNQKGLSPQLTSQLYSIPLQKLDR